MFLDVMTDIILLLFSASFVCRTLNNSGNFASLINSPLAEKGFMNDSAKAIGLDKGFGGSAPAFT